MKAILTFLTIFLLVGSVACSQAPNQKNNKVITKKHDIEGMRTAVLASGCFWCSEPLFVQLKGVGQVEVGYTGGSIANPTYEQISTGKTGHAEALKIWYDPQEITYPDLLEVFFKTHDPTTLNRQGNDIGTQYRSAIFYQSKEEFELAQEIINALDQSGYFESKIVTSLEPLEEYYAAEGYHQEYFKYNENKNPYCQVIIRPKVDKFEQVFKHKIKK